jgi:hypothetical protein
VLPDAPTQGDLDAAYLARGQAVTVCDGKRQLAIATLVAERELIDRATATPAPWWRRLWSR